jgi:hypothetical protein
MVEMAGFFFIHVMKTAGASFNLALKEHFAAGQIYPSLQLDRPETGIALDAYLKVSVLLATPPERRASVKVYTGHFPFMAHEMFDPSLTTLTILRDPVERTVAALRHFKRHARYRHLSLEDIYEDPEVFPFFVQNHQTKAFSLRPEDHEDSIICALTIDDARLEHARANLETIDVVGLTESYPDFIEEVRRRFGWWPDGLDLNRRVNVTTEGWDVGPDLRARIAVDNAYDVELYRYAQELVARRRAEA